MSPDEPAPRNPLEALATIDVESAELKTAALALIIAGKRFLNALGAGAVVQLELGGGPPIRVHVKEKRTQEAE